MKSRMKKTFLAMTLLALAIVAGLFLMGKKTASFELPIIAAKSGQVSEKVSVEPNEKKPIRILFLGDIMFDRYIRQVSDRKGYDFVFQKVDSLLNDNDLVVGNLEGPITESESVSVDSVIGSRNNYIFTFNPKISEQLAKENIKLVNIGNNHISNFAGSGIESTRKFLANSGIKFFGDPEEEKNRLVIENINNTKIAFVNYNQFVSGAQQKTLSDIEKAKGLSDFVILYTHWGKEFLTEPGDDIKVLAHKFVDSGVDLIIGSHPHVVQTKEEYKGRMIYYSLGNFIFDQYFDPNTQKGLIVQALIDPNDKRILSKDLSVKLEKNGQTRQD